MKIKPVCMTIAGALLVFAAVTSAENPKPPSTQPAASRKPRTTGFLLKTQWGQRGAYAKYSPQNKRLGCWSTALAQILYHHRLQPAGAVRYRCKKGYSLSQNLESHRFNWKRFLPRVFPKTPAAFRDEVAMYIYFTSLAIQKDFGTGSYVIGHAERAAAVARHYGCETELYASRHVRAETMKTLIRQEIDAGRPLMMHLRDRARKQFHAVAVDGYRMRGGKFFVHINMGHEGKEDGWYEYAGAVTKYDDTRYRKLIAVKPKRPDATTQPGESQRLGKAE